jgi:hypothetical protein
VGNTIDDGAGGRMSRENSIITTIRKNVAVAMNPADLEISIYPVTSTYDDPPNWEGTHDAGGPGEYMRVRARYNYPFITALMHRLVPGGTMLIQAEATYRNELFE